MKRILFISGLLLALLTRSESQVIVHLLIDTVEKSSIEICLGDSLNLVAEGEYLLMNDDFDVHYHGAQWSYMMQDVTYQNPCGTGINGTPYLWFGHLIPPQRYVETVDFNLTAGGYVQFDLLFGQQGYPTPCDGPDEQKEGISLQFSTNGGTAWQDIIYFAPDGTFLPSNPGTSLPATSGSTPFTSWDTYKFTVPPAAQTTATRFRWYQQYADYYNGHYDDNWGLDNVVVSRSINVETRWSTGDTILNPPPVHPVNDSLFVVYILNYEDLTDTLASDSLFVIVHQTPVFDFIADTTRICEGDTLLITVSGNFNYTWSNGITGPSTYVQPSENTFFAVTSIDNLGCFFSDSILINVEKLPEILSFGDTICFGQSATIMSSGGVNYSWSTGDSTAQIIINPHVSSLYIVTVTGSNTCLDSDSIFVMVNTLPNVSLTPDTTICYGNQAILQAGGGTEYYWNTGETTSSITVDPYDHTKYLLLVKDNNNCMAYDSVIVYVNPFREFSLYTSADTICLGTTVTLTAEGAYNYEWSTGDYSPEIESFPYYTTVYSVTASDIYNGLECFLQKDYQVVVSECNTLHMANAFAPKGLNNIYMPIGIFTNVIDYHFSIYDRWGKMVFHTTEPNAGWDGRIKGEFVPTGVFVYKVSYTKAFVNKRFEKIGSVTVIE